MSRHQKFQPDWASAPGETISDILTERGLSVTEFAHELGHTVEAVRQLLEGRTPITLKIARLLARVLGASVEFWILRDYQYRQDSARLNAAEEEWLADLPTRDMVKFGWVVPQPRPDEELSTYLRFFGVPSVRAWRDAYSRVQELVAFRTSPSFESRPAAVAAWLRQGEIEAESIHCLRWDPRQFEQSLLRIRPLTRVKDPARFIPQLQRVCAESGVAVAVVRTPSGCRASGATRFLSVEKALLLLSFRYLSDDQFWFSFFHEAGHLLLHGTKAIFLEGEGTRATTEEQEANEYAASILIPHEYRTELLDLLANVREVIKFAQRVGVSPGLVVGQLQHFGCIRRNQLNSLKRRFEWQE